MSETHTSDHKALNNGGVIWITGFSSAGKTAVARVVMAKILASGKQAIFLDGDDLRSILGNKWGYSPSERRELARVYFRLCSHLASQNITVVIAAVAMYREVFEWYTENLEHAIHVYLDVPEDVRRTRDARTKGIYNEVTKAATQYDIPENPDLILANDDTQDLEKLADKILEVHRASLVRPPKGDRGKGRHWNEFYKTAEAPPQPSSYAEYVQSVLATSGPAALMEVGCGNGRDAAFFHRSGHAVTAIDASESAIATCRATHSPQIDFRNHVLDETSPYSGQFDSVYSRFVIHAMTLEEEVKFHAAAYRSLKPNGRIFIECRSINDPMARKGEVLSPTERIFGHYRRFIVLEELKHRMAEAGFTVLEELEADNLAAYKDDNPVLIRITARK